MCRESRLESPARRRASRPTARLKQQSSTSPRSTARRRRSSASSLPKRPVPVQHLLQRRPSTLAPAPSRRIESSSVSDPAQLADRRPTYVSTTPSDRLTSFSTPPVGSDLVQRRVARSSRPSGRRVFAIRGRVLGRRAQDTRSRRVALFWLRLPVSREFRVPAPSPSSATSRRYHLGRRGRISPLIPRTSPRARMLPI